MNVKTTLPLEGNTMLTIEQKAAAFDALCKELAGKAKLVTYIPMPNCMVRRENGYAMHMKIGSMPIYEWTLRANGCDDFAAAALAIVKPDDALT